MKKIILLLVPFLFWNATTTSVIKKETAVVASYKVQAVRNQILEKGEFAYNFGNGLEGELKNLKETKDVTFENAPIMESFSFEGEQFVMVDDNQSVLYISDIDYSTQTQSEVFIINDPRAYNHYVRTLIDEKQAEYTAEGTVTSRNQNSFIIRKSLISKRAPKQFGPAQDSTAICGVSDTPQASLATPPPSSIMTATTFSSSTPRDYWSVILYTDEANVDYWPSVRITMKSWRSLTPSSPNTPNSMLPWPNNSYYDVRPPRPLKFFWRGYYTNYMWNLESQCSNFHTFITGSLNNQYNMPYQRTIYMFLTQRRWDSARGMVNAILGASFGTNGHSRTGVASTVSDQTLAHEIGHAIGMEHDYTLYNNGGTRFVDIMYTPLGNYLYCPSTCIFGCGTWPCNGTLYSQSYTFNGSTQRNTAKETIQNY